MALFGAALAGVPFAPINYRAPDEQLRGILGRVAGGIMIADDQEVERLDGIGATNVLTKAEFAAAIAEPVTGRASLRRPRGDRRPALHQRHDVGAQGGHPAPPAPRLVHHLERRVPRLRAHRGAADLRAARTTSPASRPC